MRHQILRTAIYISYLNRNLPRLIKVFPEAFDDVTLVIKHDKACQLRGRYLLKKRDRPPLSSLRKQLFLLALCREERGENGCFRRLDQASHYAICKSELTASLIALKMLYFLMF